MVYASTMQSIVTAAAPTGGRACFGNIRTIIGLFDDGVLRAVDAHTGTNYEYDILLYLLLPLCD